MMKTTDKAAPRSLKDGRRLWGERDADHRVCRMCGRDLPIECFERYPSGTYRHVCRRCRYENTEKPYRRRRIMT